MSKIFSLLITIFILGTNTPGKVYGQTDQDGITTYYLIRHAEKDRSNKNDKNPSLTEEGFIRANNWAKVLKDVKFDAIYSTDYNRTMQTAHPLAQANQLSIINYDPGEAFNKKLQKETIGKTVMIVGHSNTTPMFANKILEEELYEYIDDAENGALFIVQILPNGMKTSKVLYFN